MAGNDELDALERENARLQREQADNLVEIQGLKARLAALEPGTIEKITDCMWQFAETTCGHNSLSGTHALTAIAEHVAALRNRVTVLESAQADNLAEIGRLKDERIRLWYALQQGIINAGGIAEADISTDFLCLFPAEVGAIKYEQKKATARAIAAEKDRDALAALAEDRRVALEEVRSAVDSTQNFSWSSIANGTDVQVDCEEWVAIGKVFDKCGSASQTALSATPSSALAALERRIAAKTLEKIKAPLIEALLCNPLSIERTVEVALMTWTAERESTQPPAEGAGDDERAE